MTERRPGAPDPAEPPHSGGRPSPEAPPHPPAVAQFADLGAVRRTDAIFQALAERRAAASAAAPDPGRAPAAEQRPAGQSPAGPCLGEQCLGEPCSAEQRPAEETDPAVRLLRALVTDVDDPAPGRDAPPEPGPAPSGPGTRRRGPRTIVALGVAGAVLASTGVAAAGGDLGEHSAAQSPGTVRFAERFGRTPRPNAPDTDAESRTRPRPIAIAPTPARPVAERSRPPSPQPSADPERAGSTRAKPRPDGYRPRWPVPPATEPPAVPGRPSLKSGDAPPSADDLARRLDDIRRQTQRRIDQYRTPYSPYRDR
ncbi:hypothetical protein [Actinomadura fibrosa]|uniref:Uncharacterized protein n=1 Tax=Actinomadura fibrosa TaxID=111802 RepID=A0ABW2XJQ6_9ACTN|nr:hypothetical protein [Actinomadura fibrosa]